MKKPGLFHGWYIVAASLISLLLYSAVSVSIFFKPMLEDFCWDRATLSSVQFTALILIAAVSPLFGRLIDRFGPRRMILACVATQVISSVLNGIATSIWHLYLARFLYGLNTIYITQVLINNWFFKKRGTAQGILATGIPIGALILVPVSQYLINLWEWRPTMLFWALVTLVVMLPLSLIIRNHPEDIGYGPDGEPLHKGQLVDLSLKPDNANNAKLGLNNGSSLTEAAKTMSFWLLGMTQVICGIGCGFMATHIVIFATDMGYSDILAASLVSVQGGTCLVGVLVMGPLSDWIGRGKALSITHFARGLSFAVIIVFVFLEGVPPWLLYAAMVLFGFGWFTTAPLAAGLVADLFGSLRMGTILGVIMSCHMIGMAIGSYAGGFIFELTQSYYLFFLTQGPLELLAAGLALCIRMSSAALGYNQILTGPS
ncbi:MFS transporter [Chloroflexota bacterium]